MEHSAKGKAKGLMRGGCEMESIIKDVKTDNAYFKYLYARGYLISDTEYTVKDDWEKIFFQDLYITYDPKTMCHCQKAGDNFAILIGSVMDTMSWHMDANDVLKKIINYMSVSDDEGLYDYLDWLGGRFIIIFGNDNKKTLLQDATGMRSAYYHEEKCLVASHYGIISDILDLPSNSFMDRYYKSKKYSLPGDFSPYVGVLGLVPNHELDLNTMRVRRFWPRKEHDDISVNESMDFIANHIRQQMLVLNKYFKKKIALSMSGGNDSNISLAASKDIKNDVLYFSVYCDGHVSMPKDATKAKRILQSLGLKMKTIDISNARVPADAQIIFWKNYYKSHNRRAIITNLKSLPPDLLHVRSNIIETVRKIPNPAEAGDGESIRKTYYSNTKDNMCRQMFDAFSKRNDYVKLYNYNVSDILHWEYRVATFVNCACLLETDWCFDTYMLFNVRKLLERGLSVPRYFKMNYQIPFELKKRLWPETTFYVPNTNYTLLDYHSLEANGRLELSPSTVHGINGNNETEDNELVYCNMGRYSMVMGFSHSVVNKGDMIVYDKIITVPGDGSYDLQLALFAESAGEEYSSECVIYINDNQVYKVDLNDMLNIENQVNIIGNYKAKDKMKLSVQLISTKDNIFTRGVAGMIHIRNANLIKCPYELAEDKTVIASTLDWIRGDVT